ncbi:MAG: outer membrane beta-barrel protein [Chitinophagales bacterium]
MSKYHIDDIFRENLKDFEVFPSSSIWENMDLPLPIPFYRKPAFITSTVIGVLVLIGSLLYISTKSTSTSNNNISNIAINTQEVVDRNNTPYAIVIPFSPDYNISSRINSNPSNDNKVNVDQHIAHTHASSFTTSSTSSANDLEVKSSIAHTHLFHFDDGNSSPYFSISRWESMPVNTPFYSNFNTIGVNTKSISDATHYFGLYNLSSSPLTATNSLDQKISSSEGTLRDLVTDLEAIQSMPIALLDEPDIDINANDKELFVGTERDAIMSRYRQHLDLTKGFHIGGFTSAHNNWILNPALKETVTQNSNLIHQLDFGYSYGVAMGYEFSNKWGLQLEWIVNSEQGQKFSKEAVYRTSSRNSNTDINLTYTYFPVLLKYRNQRMFSLTKQPLVINYITGIQYGMLKSAEININNPVVQEDLLQLSSWGFVLGLDYDFYLNKNYFLTFGARTSLSTSSDSKYKPVFPTANTSNSLLIGLRASFNYQFD